MIGHSASARVAPLLGLLALAGCSDSHVMKTAPVTGTVSCKGAPLKDGYIIFTPVLAPSADPKSSGKSGYAVIKPDGTYTVTTYEEGDGALIGKHQVRVYKPDPEDDEQMPRDKFACGQKVLEVTVEEKDNVIPLDPGV